MTIKRIIDVLSIIVSVWLWLPLITAVTLLVLCNFGKPLLFTQARGGLHGTVFKMYKFRSMTEDCAPDGTFLPDDVRLTSFGRWLRSSSLDELPSLVNVLRGDMSIVGPRAFKASYLPLYSPEQARRHDVLPGITGWAQVNGRNTLSWEEKFAMDIWYVNHQSVWLDLKILGRTIRKVVRRDGISEEGEATMSPFTGTN